MALTISKGVNSYVDSADVTAQAAEFTSAQLAGWTALTDADQSALLIQATRAMDTLPWRGDFAQTSGQTLLWPRSGVTQRNAVEDYTYSSRVDIPDFMVAAVCREAFARAAVLSDPASAKRESLQRQGVVEIDMHASAREKFSENGVQRYGGQLVSREAWELIQPYLLRSPGFYVDGGTSGSVARLLPRVVG
jgi:hypothetical protein